MGLKCLCFLVFLLHGALSDDSLLHPCSKDDIACLSETARGFLERTSAGIKEFNIKPIDPWLSPKIQLPVADGVSVLLKNVIVIGLKNLKIDDFKIDSVKKSVVLGMKDDAEISADIVVEKSGQKASGTVFSKQSKLMTAKYTYDLVPDEKGVEYFTVGPETFTCDIEGKPSIKISEDVAKILWSDSAKGENSQKKLICDIVQTAYRDVMHNLRASAKIYPKTAYFTDL